MNILVNRLRGQHANCKCGVRPAIYYLDTSLLFDLEGSNFYDWFTVTYGKAFCDMCADYVRARVPEINHDEFFDPIYGQPRPQKDREGLRK